ncbi:hypothetical protein V8D89_006063 [Ganoderma adspersum]
MLIVARKTHRLSNSDRPEPPSAVERRKATPRREASVENGNTERPEPAVIGGQGTDVRVKAENGDMLTENVRIRGADSSPRARTKRPTVRVIACSDISRYRRTIRLYAMLPPSRAPRTLTAISHGGSQRSSSDAPRSGSSRQRKRTSVQATSKLDAEGLRQAHSAPDALAASARASLRFAIARTAAEDENVSHSPPQSRPTRRGLGSKTAARQKGRRADAD